MIQGENFTVDMEPKYNYPVLYNGGVPAEIKPATPLKNKRMPKIKIIKWSDFFQVEKNKMVVYRIIPHAAATNNNKRLWRAIHKMYEMYENPGNRIDRDGFKLHYRQKDLFFYDVIFRQEKGLRRIEFYVSTTEYQALKLKRKLENNMDVTFVVASLENLKVPVENTIIQEIKYLHHDIFSLNTNSQDTKTPISSILNTVDELVHEGDMARLSIAAEVEGRQKWVKSAIWAHEKAKKGKIPMRAGVGKKRAIAGVKIGIGGLVNEINDLLTDTFQAFSNAFFKSEKEFKKTKVVPKAHGLHDEINSKKMSGATLEKVNTPVFKTWIRVAAHSEDKLTRETLSETLALSTNDLAENNELHGIKVKINGRRVEVIEEMNTLQLGRRTRLDPDVNLMSTEEMSKLAMQMPNKDLQRKYVDELSVKKRIEVEIPKIFKEPGIPLGVAEVKDQKIPINIPVNNPDEFFRGNVFIGGQGAGKDTAIQNWVVNANLNHGISFIIPDAICEEGSRGLADGIRDSLPPENIIDLDLANEDYKIPMDLTEVITALGRNGSSRFGDEMIDFINVEKLTTSKKYLRDAAKASGGSLINIKRIIEDQDFRITRIEELIDEGNMRLANELSNWGTNEDLGDKAAPILSRLDDFFGNDALYDIFAQEPLKDIDFAKWMAEGKVIILRIPNRILGELPTKTLVHWIALKVFMTRMLMNAEEKANGAFMVFNEPEQYQTEGLTKLMGRIGTEGRKERFGSIYAFHHWNKLQPSLQENLQGGGVNQFLFMNDHTKTFDLSKHRFEDTIPLEQAYKLPAHHAIVSIRAGKELQPAFICHMAPPIKQTYNNSFLTKRHVQMYGRKWEDLQKQAL
jgi:hypothetical protein